MVISHSDEQYRINIRDYLIHRAHAVRVDAKGNLMNLAVLSEDFYAEFLNRLFDLYLKNANADKQNTAGIDLIDLENHVAIQVSLTCAPNTIREKIRNSTRKFNKPDDKEWQFYFVPITDEAPDLKKDFILPEGLKFDKDHDVLDIARLLTLALDRQKLKPLSHLVDKYSKKESDYQELKESLDRLLRNTWKNHRSFKLMHTDEIDKRLFPGIKDSQQFEALGKRKEGETESPVWSIIRESWKEPENHPIMIEGKGGIGKTVTLFSVNDMDKDLLLAPAVYVPMFELIDKNGEIINLTYYFQTCEPFASLPEEQRKGICTLAAQPWNHGPSLLVLLDGINEIPVNLRWEVLEKLRKWHTANTGAQLIAVSRPMDSLKLENAFGDSTIVITLSELKREDVAEYLKSLNEERISLPKPDSPAWDTIIYPLFLTLYIKSELLRDQKLLKGYPLMVRNIEGPGSLIWNYLQRELFRQEDEDWILRCALACEYIVPELAYRMLQRYDYTINQFEAISIIQNIVSEIVLDRMPKHLSKLFYWWKRQHFLTDLPYYLKEYNWPEFVLDETGLLTPYGESNEEQRYEFFHQSFRDCLAGLYLVNQAEMSGDNELPTVWRESQNYLALDYAAELMDEHTADKLWKANRLKLQYASSGYEKNHAGTCTLLELQKRRKPLPEKYDFSGMDISDLSLTRYLDKKEDTLPLFQNASLSRDTKVDSPTFQSEGHTMRVNCIAVLPDGGVVSGSSDNTLRVWDSSTGQCLRNLEGHSGWVRCMAVFPDGRVVSGSDDNTLRVWNPLTGQLLKELVGHTDWVNCVAILPDGNVVSGSRDGTLRIWDSQTGQFIRALEGHTDAVLCIAVCPDGCIVSGSRDRTLRVWNPRTKQCSRTLEGHLGRIICVGILPNGSVISGSYDKTLKVWDPSTGQCLETLEGHGDRVRCVAVLSNNRVISGSYDKTLRVWNPSTGNSIRVLEGHDDWILCVTILKNLKKNRVVSGSGDGTLRVWDPDTGCCLQSMEGHGDWVLCTDVSKDGRLVSGSGDSTLRVWDPLTGKCLHILGGHSVRVRCVAGLNDGKLVSGSEDKYLRIWDLSTGKCLQTLERHGGRVLCMAVLPDGRLVSGSGDNVLRVWNHTMECMKTLDGHKDWVRCVAVFPDGRMVSGSADKTLRIWNSAMNKCLKILRGHDGRVRCVAILSDNQVVSGSDDTTLRVWNPKTGRCKILREHKGSVNCVAILPDGNIVSGSADKTLKVWNPLTGECLRTLEGHDGRIQCVAILPDGRLISGSEDKNLRVWNLKTSDTPLSLKGHNDWVNCVTVLSDGSIVSGSGDGTLKVWNSDTWKCIKTLEAMEIDVSKMDFSRAVLSNELARLLWQNGAIIPEADS